MIHEICVFSRVVSKVSASIMLFSVEAGPKESSSALEIIGA
jgi:hypothetical protein